MIYVYFFIKCVLRWSENSVRFEKSYGNCLPDGPGSVRLYGPRQANLVLIAYASSESRGTFRQKARSLAPLNGWACTVKICHDGMLEGTNLLDGAHISQCEIRHVCFSRMPNLQTIKSENKMNMNNYRA